MSSGSAGNAISGWLEYLSKAVVAGLAIAFLVVAWRGSGTFSSKNTGYAEAVSLAAPAVVNIFTTKPIAFADPELPLNRQVLIRREVTNSLGSGVIIRGDGLIVTNEHLLRESGTIYVLLQDGSAAKAQIVGRDPDTDLALLKIDARNLPIVKMGRSDTLRIGDVVLAIGNPFGLGQTVTQGIVSATGRDQLNLNAIENFVQTDASINPGNSGGALVDVAGRLVAINSAVINQAGSAGIGFAIPVNLVRGVTDQLLANGRVIRGWLGLTAEPIAPHLLKPLGIESGGIIVMRVFPDTPAEKAGLRRGDIIVAVDDQPVPRVKDALNRVAQLTPGSLVQLRIVRADGEVLETSIRVTERPANAAERS
ncbi:MAG: PDZ domain-containing protein [Gammaproteobacteria bacterium]|nr:PDZ domain-containing protein [Gammaproteobacteria bacterium]